MKTNLLQVNKMIGEETEADDREKKFTRFQPFKRAEGSQMLRLTK